MQAVVKLEQNQGVATLTLNRPQVLNTLNEDMAFSLRELLGQVGSDDTVKCVIIQGAGGNFMAGGDIHAFAESLQLSPEAQQEGMLELINIVHDSIRLIREMPQPVIAVVSGIVAGFGVSLMAACDLVIATENTRFSSAYCQLGVLPDGGNTYFLPRLIGEKRAKAFTLLGEVLDAHMALSFGLINTIVSTDQLTETVQRYSQRLVIAAQPALANSKRLLNASTQNNLEQQLFAEQLSFTECTLSPDFAEGVHAFMAKRKPQFGKKENA